MLKISILWLVTKEKELLLAKRSLTKTSDPGVWGPTVAGTAEVDETADQTLAREVEEELGLKPNDYKPEFLLTKDFTHADGRVRRFSIYFALVEKDITKKFIIDEKEVAGIVWVPIGKIKEMLITESKEFQIVPSAKVVWSKTFEMLENKC